MPDGSHDKPLAYRTVLVADPALKQFVGGFTSIPNRILTNTVLSLGARMVYAMLLKYAWQEDFCFPAQARLAQDLGVTDRSIRTFLNELKDAGLITWKQQGLNRPNVYTIERLPALNPGPRGTPGPENISGPDRKPTSVQDRKPTSDYKDPKKKTQNTRVGISLKGNTPTPQLEVVTYFHVKAGHPQSQAATPKEVKQAKDLLASHPLETCRAVVDFALEKAAETNFKMRNFGAILAYVPEALASLEQTQARRRRLQEERARREAEDAQIAAERAAYFNLPPEHRLERRLSRRVVAFKTFEGRKPTPTEVEDLRRRLSREDSATTPPPDFHPRPQP
jgi:hypothetical protein